MSRRTVAPGDGGAVAAALSVVVGALVGERIGPAWSGRCVTVGAVALAVAAWRWALERARSPAPGPELPRRDLSSRRAAGAALLVGLAALGAASMAHTLGGFPARPEDRRAVLRLHLTGDPGRVGRGVRVLARRDDRGGIVLVEAWGVTAERLSRLEAGASVRLFGHLKGLAGPAARWRWRHAGAAFHASGLLSVGPAPPFLRLANALRHRVGAAGAGLPDADRALVSGLLLGDHRRMAPSVVHDFAGSGLSHLLVASGANLTLVLSVAGLALRRLGLGGRLLGGLGVVILFLTMTRFEPSMLRAAAMCAGALAAGFFGRPASGLRLLSLAVVGLIMIDPFLLHSLAFQISCGACAGIVTLSDPIGRRVPGPPAFRRPVAVTTAAQIGVAPFALPAFGHVPLAAIPANAAAVPAATLLCFWSLGVGLVSVVLGSRGPGALAVASLPSHLMASWLRGVARVAASHPGNVGAGGMVVLVLGGLLAFAAGSGCFPPAGGRPGGSTAEAPPSGGGAGPVGPHRMICRDGPVAEEGERRGSRCDQEVEPEPGAVPGRGGGPSTPVSPEPPVPSHPAPPALAPAAPRPSCTLRACGCSERAWKGRQSNAAPRLSPL